MADGGNQGQEGLGLVSKLGGGDNARTITDLLDSTPDTISDDEDFEIPTYPSGIEGVVKAYMDIKTIFDDVSRENPEFIREGEGRRSSIASPRRSASPCPGGGPEFAGDGETYLRPKYLGPKDSSGKAGNSMIEQELLREFSPSERSSKGTSQTSISNTRNARKLSPHTLGTRKQMSGQNSPNRSRQPSGSTTKIMTKSKSKAEVKVQERPTLEELYPAKLGSDSSIKNRLIGLQKRAQAARLSSFSSLSTTSGSEADVGSSTSAPYSPFSRGGEVTSTEELLERVVNAREALAEFEYGDSDYDRGAESEPIMGQGKGQGKTNEDSSTLELLRPIFTPLDSCGSTSDFVEHDSFADEFIKRYEISQTHSYSTRTGKISQQQQEVMTEQNFEVAHADGTPNDPMPNQIQKEERVGFDHVVFGTHSDYLDFDGPESWTIKYKPPVWPHQLPLDKTLTRLTALRNLNLNGSSVNSLRDLGKFLPNLVTLSVVNCQMKSLDGAPAFPNLEILYAADNQIESPAPLASLENLCYADLSGNPIKSTRDFVYLRNCEKLRCLKLMDTDICRLPTFHTDIKEYIPSLREIFPSLPYDENLFDDLEEDIDG